MNTTTFAAACLVLTGLATSARAETEAAWFNRCIYETAGNALPEDCKAVRAQYDQLMRNCMTVERQDAALKTGGGEALTGHGYKARYLVCTGNARKTFGALAH